MNKPSKFNNSIDLTGQVIGKWTVIGKSIGSKRGKETRSMWDCRCSSCGVTKSVYYYTLLSGDSKGCKTCIMNSPALTAGMVFDRLTLIKRTELKGKTWLCRCSCGTERVVVQNKLVNKRIKCCIECSMKTKSLKMTTHGYSAYGSTATTRYIKYGVTPKEFSRVLESQNGACAICDKPFTNDRDKHLDHCHKSGIFRGILCSSCNTGLGNFKDSLEVLVHASNYLSHAIDVRQFYEP